MTSLSLAVDAMRRILQSGRTLEPEIATKQFNLISRQVTRLTKLVGDLLDVSRLAAGKLSLVPEDVELVALVRDVLERLEPELSRSQCAVSVQGDASVVGRWDRSRIDQVVTNLLSNAMKFGARKPIDIFICKEASVARLAVKDHGIGVGPGQQERIFDRFERGVSKDYGGLGLGLHISRRIAEAHGGSIRVESREGEGSTFIVQLPCAGPL